MYSSSGEKWNRLGKERYIKLLESEVVRFQGDSTERPEERVRTEQQQRDDEIKKHLTNLLGELFPDEEALSSPKGIWGWLVNVLDRVGVSGTEEDAIVLQEMRGIANELQECPVPDLMPFQQMLLYARDIFAGTSSRGAAVTQARIPVHIEFAERGSAGADVSSRDG